MQRKNAQQDTSNEDVARSNRLSLTEERDEDLNSPRQHRRANSDTSIATGNVAQASGNREIEAAPSPDLDASAESLRNANRSQLPVHPAAAGDFLFRRGGHPFGMDRDSLADLLFGHRNLNRDSEFFNTMPGINAAPQQEDTMLRLLIDIRNQLIELNQRPQQPSVTSITLPQSLFANQAPRPNETRLLQTAYQVGTFLLISGLVNTDAKLFSVGLALAITASFAEMVMNAYETQKATGPFHNRPR